MQALGLFWRLRPGDEECDTVCELAAGDPNVETQVAAIKQLGDCYRGTDDVLIGKLLALIVCL